MTRAELERRLSTTALPGEAAGETASGMSIMLDAVPAGSFGFFCASKPTMNGAVFAE